MSQKNLIHSLPFDIIINEIIQKMEFDDIINFIQAYPKYKYNEQIINILLNKLKNEYLENDNEEILVNNLVNFFYKNNMFINFKPSIIQNMIDFLNSIIVNENFRSENLYINAFIWILKEGLLHPKGNRSVIPKIRKEIKELKEILDNLSIDLDEEYDELIYKVFGEEIEKDIISIFNNIISQISTNMLLVNTPEIGKLMDELQSQLDRLRTSDAGFSQAMDSFEGFYEVLQILNKTYNYNFH
jgi:hypothetical protein